MGTSNLKQAAYNYFLSVNQRCIYAELLWIGLCEQVAKPFNCCDVSVVVLWNASFALFRQLKAELVKAAKDAELV